MHRHLIVLGALALAACSGGYNYTPPVTFVPQTTTIEDTSAHKAMVKAMDSVSKVSLDARYSKGNCPREAEISLSNTETDIYEMEKQGFSTTIPNFYEENAAEMQTQTADAALAFGCLDLADLKYRAILSNNSRPYWKYHVRARVGIDDVRFAKMNKKL